MAPVNQNTVLPHEQTTFTLLFSLGLAGQTVTDPPPERFENQIREFQEWNLKNSFPEDAVLFVGSSSIRLWDTAAAFPGYRIINRGFGGSHISDVLHYYEQVVNRYSPRLVIFYAGDNDIAAGKPVEQVYDDYIRLTEQLLDDHPGVRFVYIPIKPSSSRWEYWPDMKEVNRRIEIHNGKDSRLHYVDLATPLLDSEGLPDDSLLMDDRLHLNERGYQVWNRVLRPELEMLIPATD